MKTTDCDYIRLHGTLVSDADLETVRRAVCRALDTDLVVPILGDIDEYGPKGEALGFELELRERRRGPPNEYSLLALMHASNQAREGRSVSLSDFLCARLNAGAISGWSFRDREHVEARLHWDTQNDVEKTP